MSIDNFIIESIDGKEKNDEIVGKRVIGRRRRGIENREKRDSWKEKRIFLFSLKLTILQSMKT